ncbi:MAG: 4Fe-4S binding protein, partial [Ilumatobacteraceae bacterium]
MTTIAEKPLPFLVPEYCKGCGRCIASCIKDCISLGTEINPLTGLVPIVLDLTRCNGCGLCIDACPEPFGLRPEGEEATFALLDPAQLGGPRPFDAPTPEPQPDITVGLSERAPLIVKGTYAAAVGAVLAGCRHVFGYPITPSTEGAEMMA